MCKQARRAITHMCRNLTLSGFLGNEVDYNVFWIRVKFLGFFSDVKAQVITGADGRSVFEVDFDWDLERSPADHG